MNDYQEKIDLEQVNWRQDWITRRYIAEHETELTDLSTMSPYSLAGATTYCQDIDNPYAEELTKRAGLLEKYLRTSGVERADVVRRAAKSFNIKLI